MMVLLLIVAGGLIAWGKAQYEEQGPLAQAICLRVESGSNFSTVSEALEQLRTAGLISEPDGKRYDRLRDRIIFPIRDGRGRVIGFGGRLLGDGKPKYLNSPETPVFHKGTILYGLFEARRANHGEDYLVVVEGYMDVVALAQHGIRNAVATLGTATTSDHLDRLYRVTPEVARRGPVEVSRSARQRVRARRSASRVLPTRGGSRSNHE